MPELPRISGNQAIKIFENLGFAIVRQRGIHGGIQGQIKVQGRRR